MQKNYEQADKESPLTINEAFARANNLVRNGEYIAAELIYRRLLKSAPSMIQIYYNLGATLQMQGKMREAIELYQGAIRDFLDKQSDPPEFRQHPTLRTGERSGFRVRQIADSLSVSIFSENNDQGYHRYGNDWWFNLSCEYSYQYFNLDASYPDAYFSLCQGHPDDIEADAIYNQMQDSYCKIFGRPFNSILEIGSGGGEISAMFLKHGLDFFVIEGTSSGCAHLRRRSIPENRISQMNIKELKPLGRKFDLVMCTEVAEHIEPFFASKVVEACINHGEAVWFSAADRKRRPHYHHINELGIEAWDNLFAHMGYGTFVELNHDNRGSRLYLSPKLGESILESNNYDIAKTEEDKKKDFSPEIKSIESNSLDRVLLLGTENLETARQLFKSNVRNISLEVFSFCNRKCWFCPNVTFDRKSTNVYMDEDVFSAIIHDAAAVGYSGNFHLTRFSEPLADRVIISRISAIKSAVPAATIHVTTNGDYLNSQYLKDLDAAGLDNMSISIYLGDKAPYNHEKTRDRIFQMTRKLGLPKPELVVDEINSRLAYKLNYNNIAIEFWGVNFDILGVDRGGTVQLTNNGSHLRRGPCYEPMMSITIDYNGSVLPCCNLRSDIPDHEPYIAGKITKPGDIYRIYSGATLARWRNDLLSVGDKKEPCTKCSFKEPEPTPALEALIEKVRKNIFEDNAAPPND
jgi:MoaA/NifB/PqqE/SkfB family radical SAM enzyme/tetratricopeptide (TPR) repeat protein